MSLFGATANGVIQILLDNSIPWFGLTEITDSENGSHFTVIVLRELVKALDIRWEYHMAPTLFGNS
jgi:hypothetical protein